MRLGQWCKSYPHAGRVASASSTIAPTKRIRPWRLPGTSSVMSTNFNRFPDCTGMRLQPSSYSWLAVSSLPIKPSPRGNDPVLEGSIHIPHGWNLPAQGHKIRSPRYLVQNSTSPKLDGHHSLPTRFRLLVASTSPPNDSSPCARYSASLTSPHQASSLT